MGIINNPITLKVAPAIVGIWAATSVGAQESNQTNVGAIEWQQNATVSVGDTTILKGVRHKNCRSVPTWDQIKDRLPRTRLGEFFDAGVGKTFSKRCGRREVPARAVGFRAFTTGKETYIIFKDRVAVSVTP